MFMKAVQFTTYGSPDVLAVNENATIPQISEGHILVEVAAASINPVESAFRNGYMQKMMPLTFPATTGGDFSGKVTAVGEGVTGFAVGDEVYGVANPFKGGSGAVAEFVSASAVSSAHKPTSIDHTQAAALPLVGTSALQALEEHIELKAGQKILIHGGTGGVGSMAIILAKMHGAYVVTTGSGEASEFLKGLGADEVIDYKTQDFSKTLNDIDAVFDTVGGETTTKSFAVLKKVGIIVSMAGQPDAELAKKHGVTAIGQMTKGSTEQLTRLAELVDTGKVKPVIDKTFPLAQAKDAYQYLEQGHPKGKIVITIK